MLLWVAPKATAPVLGRSQGAPFWCGTKAGALHGVQSGRLLWYGTRVGPPSHRSGQAVGVGFPDTGRHTVLNAFQDRAGRVTGLSRVGNCPCPSPPLAPPPPASFHGSAPQPIPLRWVPSVSALPARCGRPLVGSTPPRPTLCANLGFMGSETLKTLGLWPGFTCGTALPDCPPVSSVNGSFRK